MVCEHLPHLCDSIHTKHMAMALSMLKSAHLRPPEQVQRSDPALRDSVPQQPRAGAPATGMEIPRFDLPAWAKG